MNKSWYVKHSIGAVVSYITSLLGILVPSVFYRNLEEIHRADGFVAIYRYTDYYAGKILNILSVFGILFSFYFCIRIIIQAFKDNIINSINEEYKYILGLFSSYILIFLKLYAEYSLPIVYNLGTKSSFYIAVVADIPSYIGIISSIYFSIVLIIKYFKNINS